MSASTSKKGYLFLRAPPTYCILGVAFIPKLARETSFRRFFFRCTHPGKKRRTVADTCKQDKTIKTLATNINRSLQL